MTEKVSGAPLAEAHRIRNLYRLAFGNQSKTIARRRVIDALKAAEVQVVIDLWGGGISAEELVAAGIRVISVENGSMKIEDQGLPVSADRKRWAHIVSGQEGGYETFWGEVWEAVAAYPEATGAFLDFCGPWTATTKRAVEACRAMDAVLVTLVPVHDEETSGWTPLEREMSYQLVLKMAWAERPRWAMIVGIGSVRRLLDYRNPGRVAVLLYLLSHRWLTLPVVPIADRLVTRPDMKERRKASQRSWYQRPENRERILAKQAAKWTKAGPFQCICDCATEFASSRHAKYCSATCRLNARTKAQRERKLAAVSGTTAEAV